MFQRRFRPPSPALVMSMLALALVLGGTAVAASVHGDKKADTKLIKKLAPSLSVKHAKTADAADLASGLDVVAYVKGNVVDAPANGGSGYAESPGSEADCPEGELLIGTAASAGDEGVETSPSGVIGSPPTGFRVYFDNFTNTDRPSNYAIAICAQVNTPVPVGFAKGEAARR